MNSINKFWGIIDENGVGKFSDFIFQVFKFIKLLGISYIWFIGVFYYVLIIDYIEYGICGDDFDVVKGCVGLFYVVKDYYNVNFDFVDDFVKCLEEFEVFVVRIYEVGMKVIIDIVFNYVVCDYELLLVLEGVSDFGVYDDIFVEYVCDNNFYYVVGEVFEVFDGDDYKFFGGDSYFLFDGKFDEFLVKWIGNGVCVVQFDINDWYEIVKVNYGVRFDGIYDFLILFEGFSEKFFVEYVVFWEGKDVLDFWYKFRNIVYYWFDKGVDGFCYDMVEMVFVEFWLFLNSSIK